MNFDLAREYSPYPSGRDANDGTFNGERFREEVLVPLLKDAEAHNAQLVVDIDGVRTFGSSFLEEAFAGIVRHRIFSRDQLNKLLIVQCTKPHLLIFRDSIIEYIAKAKPDAVVTSH